MITIMRNQPAMKRGVFSEENMKDAVHNVIENQRSTRSMTLVDLFNPTHVGLMFVLVYIVTYVCLSIDLIICMSTASRCLPMLMRKPRRRT